MTVLSPLPIQKFFDNAGNPLNGGLLFTYAATTTTKIATYRDSTGGALNTNPIVLDYRGEANIWLDPNLTYKFVLAPATDTDPPTNPIWTVDNISPLGLTQQIIGKFLWPITQAEINAGFNDSMLSFVGPQGYIPRYRIVPNDVASAPTNAVALNRLLNPIITNGPTGLIYFPNLGGTDIYYIGDIIQIRDGCRLNLGGSTINFTKTRTAADDTMGFFTFIRDVTIENGSIVVNYNGTGGVNAGSIMRIGSRDGYPFATYSAGIFDQDDLAAHGLPLMGDITVRDLRLTTNNPSVVAVLMLGGLRNVSIQNIVGNGSGQVGTFFYYEFGASSTNAAPTVKAKWSSSHGRNLNFSNIEINNLDTTISGGAGIGLTGAYSSIIDGLTVTVANGAFNYAPGEAMFYRVWPGQDDSGGKRAITLRNIVANGITGTGSTFLALVGAQSNAGGYLSDANLIAAGLPAMTDAQKTNLMSFEVDGFACNGGGAGAAISGRTSLANGILQNGANDGIVIFDECASFTGNNIRVLGYAGNGIRGNIGLRVAGLAARNKIGSLRNSQVAGNTGIGIALDNVQGWANDNCQIGYSLAYDGFNELTQTIGVNVGTGGSGVRNIGCTVATSAGAVAYSIAGTGPRGCGVFTPFGTITVSGIWEGVVYTWTATLTPNTSGSITPANNTGRYSIRDKVVTATLYYDVTSVSAPVGTLTLSGLPIASGATINGRSAPSFFYNTLAATATGMAAQLGTGAASMIVFTRFAGGAWSSNAADIIANSAIVMELTYLTD